MAPQNSKTRGDVRKIIARMVEGSRAHPVSADHTATGGATTTLTDTKYASVYPDDYFNYWEITNQTVGFTTIITDYEGDATGGIWTFPTQTTSASGNKYEVHDRAGWSTSMFNDAIDMAIQKTIRYGALADKVDQSLAYQYSRHLYPIPTGFSYLAEILADDRTVYIARHPSGNFDALQNVKGAAANTYVAQSFKIFDHSPSVILGDVYLMLGKTGAPSGDLTLTIETDTSGSPTGVAGSVATAAAVASATGVIVDPGYIRFTFTSRPVLTKDTLYWITLTGAYAASTTACVTWANDTDAAYGHGSAKISSDGSTWSALTGDLIFTIRAQHGHNLVSLEPRRHFEVVNDSTRYVRLLPPGLTHLRDGASLMLIGQAAPGLPTADTSTLDIPYDYVVADAALSLVAQNPDFFAQYGGSNTKAILWKGMVEEISRSMRTPIKRNSLRVEAL